MDNIKKYGKLEKETAIEDRVKARNIVQEILNFGVSQQQILYVAYLLTLELENREALSTISKSIKQFLDSIGDDDNDESTNDTPSGILTT